MFKNPLLRHAAWFLSIKIVLIALGIWWFVSAMPEPRGVIHPVPENAASRP